MRSTINRSIDRAKSEETRSAQMFANEARLKTVSPILMPCVVQRHMHSTVQMHSHKEYGHGQLAIKFNDICESHTDTHWSVCVCVLWNWLGCIWSDRSMCANSPGMLKINDAYYVLHILPAKHKCERFSGRSQRHASTQCNEVKDVPAIDSLSPPPPTLLRPIISTAAFFRVHPENNRTIKRHIPNANTSIYARRRRKRSK